MRNGMQLLYQCRHMTTKVKRFGSSALRTLCNFLLAVGPVHRLVSSKVCFKGWALAQLASSRYSIRLNHDIRSEAVYSMGHACPGGVGT